MPWKALGSSPGTPDWFEIAAEGMERMLRADAVAEKNRPYRPIKQATEKRVIDIHVHIVGTGDLSTGCRMSKDFALSSTYAAMLIGLGASPYEIRDEKIMDILLNAINTSEKIDGAVLLAIDGVYKNCKYLGPESHLVVPNDYVINAARKNRRVLFGASVHPYRDPKELLAETRRCIDEGAVLFKWVPSKQQIDPWDERCIPFYIHLAREGVPLMCHTGAEFTTKTNEFRNNRLNAPRRLEKALDVGVKVIATYCAAFSNRAFPDADKSYFNELIEMLRTAQVKNWDLYADISAFCTPARISYLERIRSEVSRGTISSARFLYGSDFPMPAIDINLLKGPPDPNVLMHLKSHGNPLDNHYDFLKKFGIDDAIFTNACDVLKL